MIALEQNDNIERAENQQLGPRRKARKSTGPRTQLGKNRSRLNALRHGVSAKTVVLETESQADFDALLQALREDLQPVGVFEELKVETLARLEWRRRRVWIAETAEVRAGVEFLKWDESERNRQDAASLQQVEINGGLKRWIENSEMLRGCLDLLQTLRESLTTCSFSVESDKAILAKIYGRHDQAGDEGWRKTLFDSYLACVQSTKSPEQQTGPSGSHTSAKCKEQFVAELDEEVQKLIRYSKDQGAISQRRLDLESVRRSIPEGPQLDRLLRYEAAISREIDRTLNQLERHQRTRLGQHVPAPINLNVNGPEL